MNIAGARWWHALSNVHACIWDMKLACPDQITDKRRNAFKPTCKLERACVVQYVRGTRNEQGGPFGIEAPTQQITRDEFQQTAPLPERKYIVRIVDEESCIV